MANGILIIDKPTDWTSHDVVAKLRGILHEKRIGHAGTLDPMATGVLPVFVGRATRAVEFAAEREKEYLAGLRLGQVTDTQDVTGSTLSTAPVSVTREDVEKILAQFRGDIRQIPPMYSAIKKEGKKLYELARRGRRWSVSPGPSPFTSWSYWTSSPPRTIPCGSNAPRGRMSARSAMTSGRRWAVGERFSPCAGPGRRVLPWARR